MPISYERATDLSHKILERLSRTPGLTLNAEKEVVRNRIQKLLLEWNKELDKLEKEARNRLTQKSRCPAEGSREWDLLLSQEVDRLLEDVLARGE